MVNFYLDIYFYKYLLYLVLGFLHLMNKSLPKYYLFLGLTYILIFILSMYTYFNDKKKERDT